MWGRRSALIQIIKRVSLCDARATHKEPTLAKRNSSSFARIGALGIYSICIGTCGCKIVLSMVWAFAASNIPRSLAMRRIDGTRYVLLQLLLVFAWGQFRDPSIVRCNCKDRAMHTCHAEVRKLWWRHRSTFSPLMHMYHVNFYFYSANWS